jgi:hypothetical protein
LGCHHQLRRGLGFAFWPNAAAAVDRQKIHQQMGVSGTIIREGNIHSFIHS